MLPFRKQLKISEQIAQLMESIIACLPHTDLSERTASEWLKIWVEFAEKYGYERLEKVVNRLKFDVDFFPKPAEIQRAMDALIEEERNAAKAKRGKFAACEKCQHSGYVYGVYPSGHVNAGERWAGHCECWTQYVKGDRGVKSLERSDP